MTANITKRHIEGDQTHLYLAFAKDPNVSMQLTRRRLTDEEKSAGTETRYKAELYQVMFTVGDMNVGRAIWRNPAIQATNDDEAFEKAFAVVSEYLPDIRRAAFAVAS